MILADTPATFGVPEVSSWAQFGVNGLLLVYIIIKAIPKLVADSREDVKNISAAHDAEMQQAREEFRVMLAAQQATFERTVSQMLEGFKEERASWGKAAR